MSLARTVATSSGRNAQVEALREAVHRFQSTLNDDEQAELRHSQQDDIAANINAAIIFTAKLDQSRTAKGPSVASRFHSVLQSVWEFSTVVDTFVSSHPEIAALVWGSMKLTMKLAMNYTSYADQLSQLFMRLTHYCPRFTEYQELFPNSIQLQGALCRFYTSLISSCGHIVEVYKRSGPQLLAKLFTGQCANADAGIGARLMLNVFRSFEDEFKSDEEEIKQRGRDVKIAVEYAKMQSDEIEKLSQQQERQEASKSRRFVRTSMIKAKSYLQSIEETQANQVSAKAYKSKRSLIDSLTTYDHTIPFKEALKARHNGTAEWIFETPSFSQWANSNGSCVLFCSGKIGSGKTILTASTVSRHLVNKTNGHIAFFFIRHDKPESTKADTIVRSIVKQTLNPDSISQEVHEKLQTLYYNMCPTMEDIGQLLQPELPEQPSDLGQFIIFIDGLDEMETSERSCLLKLLRSLRGSRPRLKIFLSGRESLSEELFYNFGRVINLSMTQPLANSDVSLFIKETLKERQENGTLKLNNNDLIEEITQRLTSHADGMFLWVTYLINDVCAQMKDKDIREALQHLPKDLEDTFNRILNRITSNQHTHYARAIFQWVAVARRNLTVQELREAVSLNINMKFLSEDDMVNGIESLASWCGNLVQVDEELQTVRYAHFSIHEFFANKRPGPKAFRFDMIDTDHRAGEICLTFLHLSNFTTTLAEQVQSTSPSTLSPKGIMQHATKQASVPWLQYMIPDSLFTTSPPHDIHRKLAGFAKADSLATLRLQEEHPFLDYVRWHWAFHTTTFDEKKSFNWELLKNMVFGGHGLAIMPWSAGRGPKSNRFTWAFRNRHYALLKLCIERGNWYQTEPVWMLTTPGCGKHYDTASCILSAARDSHCDETKISAFMSACKSGNPAIAWGIVRVGSRSPVNWSAMPFIAACKLGDLLLVNELIAKGADVNRGIDEGNVKMEIWESIESPLKAASKAGHLQVVKALLDAGAYERRSGGDSAIALAAQAGHLEIVKTLSCAMQDKDGMKGKLKPNEKLLHLEAALLRACHNGRTQIAETLIAAMGTAVPKHINGQTASQFIEGLRAQNLNSGLQPPAEEKDS